MVLLMIKKKHKCTNSLMMDFLKLLAILKVPNVPSSWYKLKQIVNRSETKSTEKQQMIDSTCFFCPECEQESNSSEKCTNQHCAYKKNALIPPHTCVIMNVQHQINHVLRTIDQNDLDFPTKSRHSIISMTDIQHGNIYSNILQSLKDDHSPNFISLTCNIDGAAIYTSSEQSMWSFTACINELKRTLRFSVENIIGKISQPL